MIKCYARLNVYKGMKELTLYIITNKLYAHRGKNGVKHCMAINEQYSVSDQASSRRQQKAMQQGTGNKVYL
jgi:hypothetical protein